MTKMIAMMNHVTVKASDIIEVEGEICSANLVLTKY